MPHRQDDTTSPRKHLHICARCRRDFVVPISVLDLIDADRCIVELTCRNCGTAALEVHDDRSLMELDQRLEETTEQLREALALLELTAELERIDRFAEALHAGHILPEDF